VKGNASLRDAPRKLCPLDRHLMLASMAVCYGCVLDWEIEDRKAKDLAAGRVGEDPDYEGDEP
jgi:hypothetical protein